MKLVLDANVLVAALLRPSGWTAQSLARAGIVAVVPAHAADELVQHEGDFARRAGVGLRPWRSRVRRLLSKAVVVSPSDLRRFASHPLVRQAAAIDPDDAPYVAAYLAAGADFIWTRDRALADGLPGVAVLAPPQVPGP